MTKLFGKPKDINWDYQDNQTRGRFADCNCFKNSKGVSQRHEIKPTDWPERVENTSYGLNNIDNGDNLENVLSSLVLMSVVGLTGAILWYGGPSTRKK